MADQARAIGRRVRYWRLRRNLDRQRFADLVGRSTSWVDKVEKGERSLLRLPMLEQVAQALNVDPAVLVDGPAARRAVDCVDAVEVQAIRAALGRYPTLAPPAGLEAVMLPAVTKQLAYVDQAWLSSHFTVVARHLPALIEQAQLLTLTASDSEEVAGRRALVVAYRLASSMLLKFEAHDVAWLAADRAMHTALAVDDTQALARATRSVARAMSSTGQPTDALAALTGMADRMRPELPAHESELLALYGMLYLAASITAAGLEDAALAQAMHDEAQAAADRLRPGHDTHRTIFGPANVAVHRVAALVRLHEGGQALEYAQGISPAWIAGLPPERKVNYLLDMTQAYAHTRQYQHAVRTLADAEHVAPEEVCCRPVAHDLLRSLLDSTSGEYSRTVARIAHRAGITA